MHLITHRLNKLNIVEVYLSNEVSSLSYPMRKFSNRVRACSSLPARAFFNVPLRSSSFITDTAISGFRFLVHVYKCNYIHYDKSNHTKNILPYLLVQEG